MCLERERRAGHQLPAPLLQPIAEGGIEPGDVCAGRANAERERLPPGIEGLVAEFDDQVGPDGVAQAGGLEQLEQVALAGAREPRFVDRAGIELVSRGPERTERAAPAGVVPHGCGDDPPGPGDPRHLAQTRDGVGHEMHDELGDGSVEVAIGERQLLCGRLADVDSGVALARRGHEWLGRVDGGHALGAQPGDELAGQRPRPAPNVEHPLPRRHAREVGHLRRKRGRVAPHEPVVCVRADGKAHGGTLERRQEVAPRRGRGTSVTRAACARTATATKGATVAINERLQGVLANVGRAGTDEPELLQKREEIVDLLTTAYWMEIETVMNYVAASVNPDGLRAREVVEALETDVEEELGHARQFAQRIKELYGVVPGSMEFRAGAEVVAAAGAPDRPQHIIRGVIEAETGAIEHYARIIEVTDGVDWTTQDMVIAIMRDEEGHRRLFEGFLREFEDTAD